MKDLDKLLTYFKDKYIQIYLGEQYEEIQLDDHTYEIISVIYGKLIDVVSDFLVIDCFYVSSSKDFKEIKSGNIIFINSWQVKMMTAFDDKGTIDDILLSGKHTGSIKSMINKLK